MAGNISTYDPPLPDIRPSEVGVEATATAAYRANRAFTELGSSIEQTGRQLGQDIGQGVKADVGAAYDMACESPASGHAPRQRTGQARAG